MKVFRNKYFNITEKIKNHIAYQENEPLVVKYFDDIRDVNGTTEVLTVRRGFDHGASSWVKVNNMKEDVLQMLHDYIKDLRKSGTPRQRTIASSVQL